MYSKKLDNLYDQLRLIEAKQRKLEYRAAQIKQQIRVEEDSARRPQRATVATTSQESRGVGSRSSVTTSLFQ